MIPLPRSAVVRPRFRHASGWNGEAENAASGDAWASGWVKCIVQRAPGSEVATNHHDTLIIRWIGVAEPKDEVSRPGGDATLCKKKVT
jgi:hypothetical protein